MRRVVAVEFAASGGSAEALFAAAGCVTATPEQRERLDRAMRVAAHARQAPTRSKGAPSSLKHSVPRTRERRTLTPRTEYCATSRN